MTPSRGQLDPRLKSLLSALRWRIRAYVWVEGIAVAIIWLGLTFWAGLAVDYLPVLAGASEMPWLARAFVLALIAAGLAYVLYHWVLRRTFVKMVDCSMAVLLERRFVDFHDSLVTSVELTDHPDHAEAFSEPMLDETAHQALGSVDRVRLRDVFNFKPLVRSVLGAALLLATVLFFYASNTQALAIWVNRIYLLRDQPWPRNALIEVVGVELLGPEDAAERLTDVPLMPFENGRLKVARGSNIRLRVRADLGAKVVPEVCTIVYRTDDGDRGRVTMNKMKRTRGEYQNYAFSGKPLRGILSTIEFDVIGADYRARDYVLEVVESPTLTTTELVCTFPDYMVDEQLSLWLPRTIELTSATQLPQGTRVTIRGQSNKALKRVDLLNVDTKEMTTLTIQGDDVRYFEYPVASLDDNLTLEVTLYDVDNVVTEQPQRIFLAAVPDEPPVVDVRLRGIGTAVTPDVVIPVEGTILDDYAVDESWFNVEIAGGTGPAESRATEETRQTFELQSGGKVDAVLDFRAWRADEEGFELKAKDKLTLAIIANDRFNLGGEPPHLGMGDRYQLDVVAPDVLLAMLESQEIALRRRFERVVEEVTETRDLLNRVKSTDVQRGAEPEDTASPAGAEPEDTAGSDESPQGEGNESRDAKAAEFAQRIRSSIAEQSLQQCRKSTQELLGIATGFRDIREELINNRVDTEDRERRLEELIADPIELAAETMFPEWERQIEGLGKVLLDDMNKKEYDLDIGNQQAAQTVEQADDILAELDEILQQMLDLETFNELLDIVRQLVEDQEKLIDNTAGERKNSLLRDLQ